LKPIVVDGGALIVRLVTGMPISHHRHGQDKTVLSCLVSIGGVK